MATVTVSSETALNKALTSANGDTTIVLEAGNYGALTINGKSHTYNLGELNIVSKSSSNPAVFNSVDLSNVDDVTFDRIKFDYNSSSGTSKPFVFNGTTNVTVVNSEIDGMSGGQGFWVKESSDFRVQNSEFSKFSKALVAFTTKDLQVIGNSFSGAAEDTMTFSRIDGAVIQGNSAKMGANSISHRDFLQFYNTDGSRTSSDIVIKDNVFETSSGGIHGIYMANEVARSTGDIDDFYENVIIQNNTIKSGQFLGIAVGEAVGVKVSGNVLLQSSGTSHASTIPMILVDDDARQVAVTGNTTHKTPSAAGENWQPTGSKPSGWTISDNKIVPLGTSSGTASGGSSSGGSTSAPVAPETPGLPSGNDTADEFRFNGKKIDGQAKVTFKNVDFKEGDCIILSNFDNGTFRHYAGDNGMAINADKNWIKLNSLVDLQELVTASPDVTARFQTTNNTLVMRIEQDDGSLDIALPGYASAYKATFNADLF